MPGVAMLISQHCYSEGAVSSSSKENVLEGGQAEWVLGWLLENRMLRDDNSNASALMLNC